MRTSKLFIAIAAGLMLCGCNVKDPIYDLGPDQAQLTVITDWSGIGAGAVRPSSWLATFGGQSVTINADTYTFPNLFDPGSYTFYFYNEPDQITVNNNTATVASSDGNLNSLPGWLFSGTLQATLERDTDHTLTVAMNQQVRQLTIILDPTGGSTDRISDITATLTGVAGSLDLTTGTHGSSSQIALNFTEITSGADAGMWTVTVRLLGITGSTQSLSGTVTFTDSAPSSVPLTIDLSSALLNFNADKPTPLILRGNMVETPTSAGFTGTIEPWTPGQGQTGSVN